ncbi:hypothetical protein L0128_01095 [candidate division KSB1 bacterium]|nr:hypothetical protein [candidate division KSB1 bacterium]
MRKLWYSPCLLLIGLIGFIWNPARITAQSQINLESRPQMVHFACILDSIDLMQNQYVTPVLTGLTQTPAITRISATDSLKVRELLIQFTRNYTTYSKMTPATPAANEERFQLLSQMRLDIEAAVNLKPYDPAVLRTIRWTYVELERHYRAQEQWKNYLQVASNHLHLAEPKDRYRLWLLLGDAYNKLAAVPYACAAFDSASSILFKMYADSLENGPEHYRNTAFSCLSNRGSCEEKLYLHEAALRSWEYALQLAPVSQHAAIQTRIKRILLWDGGNLRAFEKRNAALVFFREKEYHAAKAALEALLPQLKTAAAQAEIKWWLALVDLNLGQHYVGLQQMWQILQEYADVVPDSALAQDSTYQNYLKIYAQRCFTQGRYEIENKHLHAAYIYLSKAAEIKNPSQRLACLLIANLLSSDGNSIFHTDAVIRYGQFAWEHHEGLLPAGSKSTLARILSRAYRQNGDFTAATEWLKKAYSEVD